MPAKPSPKFPLPPRKDKETPPRNSRPLHRRAAAAVASAPGKILQRVNQELYKRNAELAARNKTLALLRKLDETSLATLSLHEMANQMAAAIAEALGYDLVSVVIARDDHQDWQTVGLASSVPWMKTALANIDIAALPPLAASGPIRAAVESGRVQFSDDPGEVYAPALIAALRRADQTPGVEEIKHSLLFPLRFGQNTLGLLKISASRSLQNISSYERDSVLGIIGLVALAVYKAKIYQDLQETTDKLAEANDQLKDLDKAKSEFLSIASHQLYTPLTALRGYLSMLQEGDFGVLPEKQAPIIKILEESANRLITLIKSLLDISRIEAGRLELKLESVDIVEMGQQMVQDLMPNARAKNLGLEFHAATVPVPPVAVDRERIRQVMLNFIDNSIKYTPQGKVDVFVTRQGDTATFSVKDTGKGLKPEEIRRLFTKFTRVGGSDHLHTEGTGLGLYVAQQIVKEHHGQVKAESPGPDKGSTFSMTLPIEGSPQSLKVGEHTTVEIKAAESKSDSDR